MKFGLERLIEDKALRAPLAGKRVALVAHPASVTARLDHALDVLSALDDIKLAAAFGPQHGLKGDKQDNMVESADFTDPIHGIPVFSLYGEVRRPTGQMMSTFDVVLIDLQDLGCRIYTFITTLLYMLEEAARHGKSVWVLDRPNPAGRPVEGLALREGWESFVGAGPMPMRHGLTLGELGRWFIDHYRLDVDYRVIAMEGYDPDAAPGFGWPAERVWVNPSPNAANLNMARAYAGTVMLEGTTLSEGRGTTRPLELFGAPDIDAVKVMAEMRKLAPEWLTGCALREIWFEPTFHKHAKKHCGALQVHVTERTRFDAYRFGLAVCAAVKKLWPADFAWRTEAYEFRDDVPAIDLLTGRPAVREAIDAGLDFDRIVGLALGGTEVYDAGREAALLYD